MSAGASPPSPAALVAPGWSPRSGGCGRGMPGRGLRMVAAVGVCRRLGARLELRGGLGDQRLGYYVMQQGIASSGPDCGDVGEKGPLPSYPFKGFLLATVLLGRLPLGVHTFSLVTVERGIECGGFLLAPRGRGGDRGMGIVPRSALSPSCRSGSEMEGWDFRGGFPIVRSGTPPGTHPADLALPRMWTKAPDAHTHTHKVFTRPPCRGGWKY